MRYLILFLLLCGSLSAQMLQSITNDVKHGVVVTGGWTFDQGTSGSHTGNGGSFQVQNVSGCHTVNAICTIQIQPSQAGSVREIGGLTQGSDNLTVSAAWDCSSTNGSGDCDSSHKLDTASLCAASACHTNSADANTDLAYIVNGAANATFVTVQLSGTPTGDWFLEFMEVSPPLCNGSPCTTSFDANKTMHFASGTCNTLCTDGAGMTLTGTDAVIGMINSSATVGSFAVPYQIDSVGNVFAVDATSAPAYTVKTTGFVTLSNIAFKSSAGSFSPSPAAIFTNKFQAPGDTGGNQLVYQLVCTPTCASLTLPATSVNGDLLVLFNGPNSNSAEFSSISNAGTWVIPSGASTCKQTSNSTIHAGCAYVLSSTSGATTLSITMSTNCTCNFIFTEISRSSGSFVLDAQNSTSVGTGANPIVGPSLSLSGTIDVCFAESLWTTSTPFEWLDQFYPLPGGRNEFGPAGSPVGGVLGVNTNVRSFQTQNVLLSATPTNSTSTAICFK